MVQFQIHPPLIARGGRQDAAGSTPAFGARDPGSKPGGRTFWPHRQAERQMPAKHLCVGPNPTVASLWVRSSKAEFASLKRAVGVQIAPGLPVPLYWPCLLNKWCITGRCWFKSSQGCSCSHSSIGSERHPAKVAVDRSNRSESASQNGFWKGG